MCHLKCILGRCEESAQFGDGLQTCISVSLVMEMYRRKYRSSLLKTALSVSSRSRTRI